MTTEYKCNVCKYITDDKSNYNKHLKSKKHLNTVAVATTSVVGVVSYPKNSRQRS